MAKPRHYHPHPAVHMNNPNFFVWASLVIVTLLTIAVAALIFRLQVTQQVYAFPAEPSPDGWVTNGTVNKIISDSDRTYVGGNFTYVGEYTGGSAVVDGTTGEISMDTDPLHLGTGSALTSEADPNGGWYVAGSFRQQLNSSIDGDNTVYRIAHYNSDGTHDTTFDVEFRNTAGETVDDLLYDVRTADPDDDVLYIAGNFSNLHHGGVSNARNDLAAVDAQDGTVLSWNPGTNSSAAGLAMNGDRLYVTGAFTGIGGGTGTTSRSRIAALGKVGATEIAEAAVYNWAPVLCTQGEVIAVKSDNSYVFVGGAFATAGSAGATCAATTRRAFAAFDGATTTSTGTLQNWTPGTNTSSTGWAIAFNADESTVYLGGNFTGMTDSSGFAGHRYLAAATTDATQAVPISSTWVANVNSIVYDLKLKGTDLVAVGAFTKNFANTINRYHVASFDGDRTGTGAMTNWDPKTSETVHGVEIIGSNVILTGDFSSAGGDYRYKLAAFDNDTLALDTSFDPGTAFNDVSSQDIIDMALDSTYLYAGGDFLIGNGATRNRLSRVALSNGAVDAAWDPNPNGTINALLVDGNFLYVGGGFNGASAFDPAGAAPAADVDRIARLDTTINTGVTNPQDATWEPYDAATVITIDALKQDGSYVYIAGNIPATVTVGGKADTDLFKISKATPATADPAFESLVDGTTTAQLAISPDGSQLYLGQNNDLARISTANGSLDASWFSGTANTQSTIHALEYDSNNTAGDTSDDKVYVGGNFSWVGTSGTTRLRAAEIALDGTVSAWNPGFDANVLDFERAGSSLHVGGSFATAGRAGVTTIENRTGYAIYSSNEIGFTLTSSSGGEAVTPANLEVTLAATDGSDATVQYAVTGGSASGSGVDYTLASGTATVTAGNLTTVIPITIINDGFDEADETIVVSLSSPSSNAVLSSNTVHTYTILDNDIPGVTVTESSGSTAVTEGGPTDTYTVVLTSEPASNVVITLGSGGEATGAPSPLTFTNGNWSTPQTVTVTATNDDIAEGPHGDTITHTAASSDPSYNAISIANVSVAITDNDTAGVAINESGGSTQVTEGGSGDSYDVVLTSEPSANVVVALTVDAQLNAGPSPLTFTTGNWDTPQTVTVNADDDAVSEGLHFGSITHSAASGDADYNGISVDQVDVTITDNDAPAVIVTESGGGTTVTEGGPTDSYTVVLNTQPTGSVTINLTPDGEITVAPNPLTFTTGNWDTPQSVTVTAVNDEIAEGVHLGVVAHAATSSDGDYNGIAIVNVTASITDNDTAGIAIVQSGGTTQAAEGGSGDSYTVALTSEPTANVTVTLNPDSQVTAVTSPLTFTSGNWDTPQTVAVGAINDSIAEGNHTGNVGHALASADSFYNALVVPSVSVNITDNDTAGVIVNESGGDTIVTEGGATDSYTVVLTSEPTADTQIILTPSGQVTVMPSALLFNSTDWNIAQTVIVTAIDDSAVEGTHNAVIVQSSDSSDPTYSGIAVDDVSVTITDDDSGSTPSGPTPTPTPTPPGPAPEEGQAVNQIAGTSARAQSIAVSQTRFSEPGSANGAVIATERTAVDAYTSTPLVSQNGYMLMLSDGENVSADTLVEMRRAMGNMGKPVYLIGGTAALSENVEEDIRAVGFSNVLRLAGKDRRRTAELVAEAITQHNPQGISDTIFLGEDRELIDGLSAGSAAGTLVNGYAKPILITIRGNNQLDPTVSSFVKNHAVRQVLIIGGATAVPLEVENQLRTIAPDINIIRYAGADRFETNKKIVDAFFPAPNVAIASRGDRAGIPGATIGATATQPNTLVTALLANTLGGTLQAPVVLITATSIPQPTVQYLQEHAATINKLYIVGDFTKITQTVVDALGSLI
jgi:hypothetical protein